VNKLYLLIAILVAMACFTCYQWGAANTKAIMSEDTAKVVEQALQAYQQEVADANTKNFELKQKAQLDSQRIKRLREKLDSVPDGCTVRPSTLRVFLEAVSDKRLSPESTPFYSDSERVSTDSYCLYAIGEANRVKVKLNNLIDDL
jgi:type II secretory pathway pseudopilin PulG